MVNDNPEVEPSADEIPTPDHGRLQAVRLALDKPS